MELILEFCLYRRMIHHKRVLTPNREELPHKGSQKGVAYPKGGILSGTY